MLIARKVVQDRCVRREDIGETWLGKRWVLRVGGRYDGSSVPVTLDS